MARIAVCGLGTIGSQVARLLVEHRRDVELVGVASKDPQQIGRPLQEVLGIDGPVVADSIVPLIEQQPDAIVLATGSFLPDVHDDVLACARAGVSLVSPCEELAYPYTRDPAVAEEIDAAARAGGATILMITHDGGLADQLTRRIRVLDGQVVSDTAGERSVPAVPVRVATEGQRS